MGRRTGTRTTRQLKAVLEEMERFGSKHFHPTAAEVYSAVKKRLPRISLATVYRNLEKLAEQGEILKLSVPNAAARFDANTEPHHHIRCIVCGRVDDLPADISVKLPRGMSEVEGYEVVGYSVEVIGICKRCRSKGRRRKATKRGATLQSKRKGV